MNGCADSGHLGSDEYADDKDDDQRNDDKGDYPESVFDIFGEGVPVGHEPADARPYEHIHNRNARHAHCVTGQRDNSEVGPRLAGAEQHPSAEQRRYQRGDAHVHRRVIPRHGILFHALPSAPNIAQAQVQECGAHQHHRGDADPGVQHSLSFQDGL